MTTAANAIAGGSSAAGQTGQTPEGQVATPSTFDQAEFNKNLQTTLAQRDQQLMSTILTAVSKMNEGQNRAIADVSKNAPTNDEIMQEYASEIDALGMDEKSTQAFVSLATKIFNKKAPEVKEEVRGEIKSDITFEEQKRAYNAEAVSAYPQALDDNSALRAQARIEYQNMDPHLLKSPRASKIAIETAAKKLGIQPLTVADIRSQQAQTENGNGGNGKQVETGPSREQVDFAMGFGVKKDAFTKHLAIIKKREAAIVG